MSNLKIFIDYVIHEKPLTNALGPGFRGVLTNKCGRYSRRCEWNEVLWGACAFVL